MILQNYIRTGRKGHLRWQKKKKQNPVQSAERIFRVLEMLAEHGEMVNGDQQNSTSQKYGPPLINNVLDLYGVCKTGRDNAEIHAFLQNREHGGKILERTDILQIAKPYMERLSDISGDKSILYKGKATTFCTRINRSKSWHNPHGITRWHGASDVLFRRGQVIMATLPEKEVKTDLEREHYREENG